jgi:hypothetical protein
MRKQNRTGRGRAEPALPIPARGLDDAGKMKASFVVANEAKEALLEVGAAVPPSRRPLQPRSEFPRKAASKTAIAASRRNLPADNTLRGMRPKLASEARARAEAIFNHRQRRKADALIAAAEYRSVQEATAERRRDLRRPRLARKDKG